jgi:hypothetical protein
MDRYKIFEGKSFLYMDYSTVDSTQRRDTQWIMVQIRERR